MTPSAPICGPWWRRYEHIGNGCGWRRDVTMLSLHADCVRKLMLPSPVPAFGRWRAPMRYDRLALIVLAVACLAFEVVA